VKSSRLASIDLGTNTARLLIGSIDDGQLQRLHVIRRITRLGGGFTRDKGISPEAEQRTEAAMVEFAAAMRDFGVQSVKAVATSAVRDAVNRESFCSRVKAASGIDLEVIGGDEEGRLTLQGVIIGLDSSPERLVVFDVGGGSTEYTIAAGEQVLFSRSLPLGVVRLTEGKGSVPAMSDKIGRELEKLLKEIEAEGAAPLLKGATLVATAGTATTLAAIDLGLADYDYRKVNNHVISIGRIREIFLRLLPLTPPERLLQIIGLEAGREDLIIAGSLLTITSMEVLGIEQIKISDYGLLEGVLLELGRSFNSLSCQ
jgi:exopolyphosphatase/guanosine-5'-triphosphate,3'-diphosphate pyrophosphatase